LTAVLACQGLIWAAEEEEMGGTISGLDRGRMLSSERSVVEMVSLSSQGSDLLLVAIDWLVRHESIQSRILRTAAHTKWSQFRGGTRTKREFHGSATTRGKEEVEASCLYPTRERSFTLGTT